ncbi:hypothetical protein DPMN_122287 [Dreissena polymorpha]|uniref:Uncharacterized protein n=1 Tax=Dreissena polymorpha TaxID=45954 RepID=A0A9D4GRL7_DREPO|nr:hypothetical protein DPMN_122287 [Dreissena polymorpha]
MFRINSSLVAFTVLGQVRFFRVTNGQLIKDRKVRLQHQCRGISHYQGDLYITDGSALYHYTVDDGLVGQMYENTSGRMTATISTCAVSPDGDRIYVANKDSNQLVTLSRDGTVISTLIDHALNWKYDPPGLHVTDSEQVLVCGGGSNTILKVERDGDKRLAEVVTLEDVETEATSVYYSNHTGSIIVGILSDYIIVFKAQ